MAPWKVCEQDYYLPQCYWHHLRKTKTIAVHVVCIFEEQGSQWQDTIFSI